MGIEEKNTTLLDKSPPNFFKRLFFLWLCPIFYKAQIRELEEDDLVPAKKMYASNGLGDKLEERWVTEVENAKKAGKEPSLIRPLWQVFRGRIMYIFIPVIIQATLRIIQPQIFALLLTYWSVDTTTTLEDAIIYAAGVVLCSWSNAFVSHHCMIIQQQLGMSLRIATTSLMYRKMMRMSLRSLSETAAGKVINLMSNDVSKFDIGFMFLHQLCVIPFQLAIAIYFMYTAAGISAIIGLAVMFVIVLPIQGGLSKLLGKMRGKSAVRTDSRIKVMSEIINGIQVIKMYAWEKPFAKVVELLRAHEMQAIRKAGLVRLISVGFMMITERSSLFLCLLMYTLLGNVPSAGMVYPLQQYFSIVQAGIGIYLPMGIAFGIEMLVSIRRIREYLILGERADVSRIIPQKTKPIFNKNKKSDENLEPKSIKYYSTNILQDEGHLNKGFKLSELSAPAPEFMVELKDLSASWTDDGPETLKNISMRVKPGSLCAVIGPVGSGKSSLLQILLKELPISKGSMKINGSVSYAAQEAWLFPKSVRDNILFGLPYDPIRYKDVCKVCCLEKDFKQFLFGDQTLVGERGVSLSGGQRARINLARAIYRDADLYLLDDPLSAVDANVGRRLFEECISRSLRGKTRILVTHQIHYLKTVDWIVVLNEGKIENIGTYDELVKSAKDFSLLLNSLEEDVESIKSAEKPRSSIIRARLDSVTSEKSDLEEEHAVQTLEPEARTMGRLKWSVASAYLSASGVGVIALTLLLIATSQLCATFIDYWISYWMNSIAEWQEENGGDPQLDTVIGDWNLPNMYYLVIYGGFIAICIVTVNLRALSVATLAFRSSKALHQRMFNSMLETVMRFFDTSSSGRILNRFSKDMGGVDENLPRSFLDTVQIYLTLTSTLILNVVALPWTLISIFALLIVNFLMVKMYLNASQVIKRIEGTTKSPVYGMVSSSLGGIATIRSATAEQRLIGDFDQAQDVHTCAFNTYLGGAAAFGFFLDTVCMMYISLIMATFLFIDLDGVMPIGSVGLAVSQSLSLMFLLQFGARCTSDLLGQLTAVERILEYTVLDKEKNLLDGETATPPAWPLEGKIIFDKVYMSYAPDTPPVLKNLNFTVQGGYKVGIVGRTGAGKSSLIAALFRFAHLEGNISIDGTDTSSLAKQELRKRISIIPQEPVLFSATIRYNLDPFDLASDEEIWNALEMVELKEAIPDLDFKVSEGGSNFSVGQRQLVCLARAILKSNKILIMDEATANVDPQTDAFIQQTIRRQFAKCTVLTIAHRLNTIMDSDMVLVMDSGEVAEYDHPYILMSDPNSKFTSMARETGPGMQNQLLEIAREAYFRSNLQENSLTKDIIDKKIE